MNVLLRKVFSGSAEGEVGTQFVSVAGESCFGHSKSQKCHSGLRLVPGRHERRAHGRFVASRPPPSQGNHKMGSRLEYAALCRAVVVYQRKNRSQVTNFILLLLQI